MCRTTISEVYQTGSVVPVAGNWGCESSAASSKYVASVTTTVDGLVEVTLSADPALTAASINGNILTLFPATSARAQILATTATVGATQVYQWVCGSTALGTVKTVTTLSKYLPGSCRG